MAISRPFDSDLGQGVLSKELPLDKNFVRPPPVEPLKATGKPAQGKAVAPSAGGTPASTTTGTTTPVEPKPIQHTRMGIGPGGPALGNEEARALLNAPPTIAGAQQLTDYASQRGEEISGQFRQQAGAPIQYGREQQDIISAAMRPFAEGQETQQRDAFRAAQKATDRSYEGPEVQDVGGTQEALRSARYAQGGAEAIGMGRAGTTTMGAGKDAAELARLHGQPGFSRTARQTSAGAANVAGGLGADFRESLAVGQQRQAQAGQARSAAHADLSARQDAITREVGDIAEKKSEQIQEGAEKFDEFLRTGQTEGLGVDIQNRINSGVSSLNDARNDYMAIHNDPEFESIKGEDLLELKFHYTGPQILMPSANAVRKWEDEFSGQGIDSVFRAWKFQDTGGSRPGRGLHRLLNLAADGNRAAIKLKNRLNLIHKRQGQYEMKFSPELPAFLDVQGHESSIFSPDQLAAQGEALRAGKGHYMYRNLRPQVGIRGQHAAIAPLYLEESGVREAPNWLTQSSEYWNRPEGAPSIHTEMPKHLANEWNVANRLRGGQNVYTEGSPIDPNLSLDFGKLMDDERAFAERAGERLSEAELRHRVQRKELRSRFEKMYDRADSNLLGHVGDFIEGVPMGAISGAAAGASAGAGIGSMLGGTGGALTGLGWGALIGGVGGGIAGGIGGINKYESDDYKRAPIATPGGLRGVPDEEFWGIRRPA